MNSGKYVFSQLLHFIDRYEFQKCVAKYNGDFRTREFNCWNQFIQLLFGQLTSRNSTGLLCDPKHPALKEFPTDFHADWQWWDLCTQSTAMVLPDSTISSIVRQIDNFANNRQLANVFEAAVGNGRLLVCSFDISTNLEDRAVARQFRHSLLKYMNSAAFSPKVSISADKLLSKDTKNRFLRRERIRLVLGN